MVHGTAPTRCAAAPVRFTPLVFALLACALLAALPSACGDGESAEARTALTNPPDVLLLRPTGGAANAARTVRIELARGGLAAPPLGEVPLLRHFAARQGGWQGLVTPDVEDGKAGTTVRFAAAGDALLAATTAPETVAGVTVTDCAKCVFPVALPAADAPPGSAAVVERVGQPLELVPMLDPLALLPNETLPVRLHFDGPGLADVRVSAEYRASPDAEPTNVFWGTTDEVGSFLLPIPAAGEYLLTASHETVDGSGARHAFRASLCFTIGRPR